MALSRRTTDGRRRLRQAFGVAVACGLGALEDLQQLPIRDLIRIVDDLNQSLSIPQVDKDHTAMIPAA